MIKFSEIKMGGYVMAEYNGQLRRGEVKRLNGDEKQVCVETDVQEFWYETQHLLPIAINDDELLKLNFSKEELPDGTVKYKKGSFRLVIPRKDDFSTLEMWYREDRRHFSFPLGVHELQNLHLDMTKVPLEV